MNADTDARLARPSTTDHPRQRTERTSDDGQNGDLWEVGEEEHRDDDTDGGQGGFEERRQHRLKEGGVYEEGRTLVS